MKFLSAIWQAIYVVAGILVAIPFIIILVIFDKDIEP